MFQKVPCIRVLAKFGSNYQMKSEDNTVDNIESDGSDHNNNGSDDDDLSYSSLKRFHVVYFL